MSVFVDTSALLAYLDADQPGHAAVADALGGLLEEAEVLFTTNYVLVETCALVQHRLGLDALRALISRIVPLLEPVWIDEALHEAALGVLFAVGTRRLSLVDCTSFEVMRRLGLDRVLALDRDFALQGFSVLPPT